MKKNLFSALLVLAAGTLMAAEPPVVTAKSALLFDANTGRVIFKKNEEERRPVASTQKLLTAYIIANAGDLSDLVTIKEVDTNCEPTKLGVRPGQQYTRDQLLRALLVHSCNDAARALARDNAGRNPSRTAATAAALMIGLALVVFIAVFAQAMKSSFGGAIDKSTRAELVVQDRTAFMGVPQKTIRSLDAVHGVDTAAGTGYADLQVKKGGVMSAYAVDPAIFARVWALDWRRGGSDALLGKLDAHHVLLEDGSQLAAKVKAGDTITVTTQGGKKARLTVLGFYRDQMAFTGMITSLDAFKGVGLPTASVLTMVRTRDGANIGATQDAVEKALSAFPTQKVMTKGEYLATINKQVDQILMMFYGLLAMSVLISIFGIINTLVLSVHERTREIGMLRAIGATRRQLRQMVRYESIITAVIGGVLGTAVGIAMAYVIVTQLGGDGLVFGLPWVQLGVFMVLAVVVGVIAAVLPARRAGSTAAITPTTTARTRNTPSCVHGRLKVSPSPPSWVTIT